MSRSQSRSSRSQDIETAISKYCTYKTEMSAMEKRRADAVGKLTKKHQTTRDALENWMVSNKVNTVYLPGENDTTKCLRLRQTATQRAINEKCVRAALDDFLGQIDPKEELSLKDSNSVVESVYQAVHKQCVQKGHAISLTECKKIPADQKLDASVLRDLSRCADVYDATRKELQTKRKHYSEARVILTEKMQVQETPVKRHLLEQKEVKGAPVQKVTLTCQDQDPEDVSLRYQQRKTVRCTKRLGLKLLREMVKSIIDRRSKQLAERKIYNVRWKDFLPVILEDLVTEINEFQSTHREESVHESVCMRRAPTGYQRRPASVVPEKTNKKKHPKKRKTQ